MYLTYPIDSNLEVIQTAAPDLILSKATEEQIEQTWEFTQQTTNCFNGQILSVNKIESDIIYVNCVQYKHWVAQLEHPELFQILKISPLAVSGMLVGLDGVVFGERTQSVMQDKKKWELAPSGGVDYSENNRYQVDYKSQLLKELKEEIGIVENIRELSPFLIAINEENHVVDICILLKVDISCEDFDNNYTHRQCKEYEVLKMVPFAQINLFIESRPMCLLSEILVKNRKMDKI